MQIASIVLISDKPYSKLPYDFYAISNKLVLFDSSTNLFWVPRTKIHYNNNQKYRWENWLFDLKYLQLKILNNHLPELMQNLICKIINKVIAKKFAKSNWLSILYSTV